MTGTFSIPHEKPTRLTCVAGSNKRSASLTAISRQYHLLDDVQCSRPALQPSRQFPVDPTLCLDVLLLAIRTFATHISVDAPQRSEIAWLWQSGAVCWALRPPVPARNSLSQLINRFNHPNSNQPAERLHGGKHSGPLTVESVTLPP